MPEVAAPATTHLGPRGPSRSRHLAAVLAIGITLSSSGIAAAVTGDPLLPIKTVVKNVYEIGHHDTSKSDWILGGRDGVDRTLRETFGVKNLTSRSQTRATDGLHNAHGRTPMEIRLRDDARRDSPNDRSTNPAAAPGAPVDDTDETPPTVPATSEPPGQTTAPGQPDDTDAPDGNTNGNPDGTGKPDQPHHANNGSDNPGKPETNPGVGAGSTDDPDGCSTDSSADADHGSAGQARLPEAAPDPSDAPGPEAPEADGRHDDPDVGGRPCRGARRLAGPALVPWVHGSDLLRGAGQVRGPGAHLRRRPAAARRDRRRSQRGGHQRAADPRDRAAYPAGLERDGHRHRVADGDRDGAPGRARRPAPQPVDRGPGLPGRPRQADPDRHDLQPRHDPPEGHPRGARRDLRPVPRLRACRSSTRTTGCSASSPTATCGSSRSASGARDWSAT